MSDKKRVNIGFDIGITSVGWAIVDEDNNIIDRGVRRFEELKNHKNGKLKNEERRDKRHTRRTINRRRNRKDDFIKLVAKNYSNVFNINWINDGTLKDQLQKTKEQFLKTIIPTNHTNVNLFEIINRGLKSEIKPIELLRILYYYLSHRGYSYITFEMYKNMENIVEIIFKNKEYKEFANWYLNLKNKNESDDLINDKASKINYKKDFSTIKSFLSKIKKYNVEINNYKIDGDKLIKLFPSQIQEKSFIENDFFRGNKNINDKFSIHDWKKEIETILYNQTYLKNNNFINDYLNIFTRLRDFSQGPGSEKSPTKYGLYKEKGKGKVAGNLWDLTIGKCSIFPDEDRTNKKACSAEISNILNQLNTLSIKDFERGNEHLQQNEKEEIILESILKNKDITPKFIADIINIDETNIFKYPTLTKKENNSSGDNSNFEPLKNTRYFSKIFNWKESIKSLDELYNKINFCNEIMVIYSKYPSNIEQLRKELNKKFKDENFDGNSIELAVETLIKDNKVDYKDTSDKSLKAHNLYIKEEIKDNGKTLNQKFKKIIEENQKKNFKFSNSKYINYKWLDDPNFILSPTTKCSFRESLKVFNKILKRFIYNGDYFLKNVVIEMPTEWNSKKEKEKIEEIQRIDEERKELVKKNFEYYGDNKTIILKLVLLLTQENLDAYTREIIDYQRVINDPSYTQIDHIIPYSISYDNSFNNKVLVLSSTNQQKGKKTPREYLGNKINNIEEWWIKLYKNNDSSFKNLKKFEKLTTHLSSSEIDQKTLGFIGRNLSDTRYACRLVNEILNAWVDSRNSLKSNVNNNEILSDGDVNIININGKHTSMIRNNYLKLQKDRNENHEHHAVDASICAMLGNSKEEIGKLIWKRKVDNGTGEVFFKSEFSHFKYSNEIQWHQLKTNIESFPIKFSYKITKKNNMGYWGDTIIPVVVNGDKIYQTKYFQPCVNAKFNKIKNEFDEFIKSNDSYIDINIKEDLKKAFNEGCKIINENDSYKGKNPFTLYMDKYCELNDLNKDLFQGSILLEDKNGKRYKVKKMRFGKNGINSYELITKIIPSLKNKFGAYTNLGWKEIRLYLDNKDKYRVIPMKSSIYIQNLTSINKDKYINYLKQFNINPSKEKRYFLIHKGSLLIKKDDKTIWYIAGGHFEENKLNVKPVYKNIDQNNVAISSILKEYNFATSDELGNITIISDEELNNKLK